MNMVTTSKIWTQIKLVSEEAETEDKKEAKEDEEEGEEDEVGQFLMKFRPLS